MVVVWSPELEEVKACLALKVDVNTVSEDFTPTTTLHVSTVSDSFLDQSLGHRNPGLRIIFSFPP